MRSLRFKISWIITLAATVPILLLGMIISASSFFSQKSQAIQLQHEVSHQYAVGIEQQLQQRLDLLQQSANIYNFSSMSSSEQQMTLSQLKRIYKQGVQDIFHSLSLVENDSGAEVARVSRVEVYADEDLRNMSTNPIFKQALSTLKVTYGDYHFKSSAEEPHFSAVIPLINKRSGGASGVLLADLRLLKLFQPVTEKTFSTTGLIYVTDGRGIILVHSDPSQKFKAVMEDEYTFKNVFSKRSADGQKVLLVQEKINIGPKEFVLVTERPYSEIYKLTLHSLRTMAFFLFLVLAVSLYLAFRLANALVQPIEQLSETAKAISRGDLQLRTESTTNDEIGELAESFNSMTDRLLADIEHRKEVEAELREARDQLWSKVNERTSSLYYANEKLKKARAGLETRVQKRTAQLEESNSALIKEIAERVKMEKEKELLQVKAATQSRLASLGEVATGIAHEINQPLSFLRIIFESAMRDLIDDDFNLSEFNDDCIESLRQISRISLIIDHLRTFGRIEAIDHEPVNLREILDNTLILMGERLRLRNITLEIDSDDPMPNILASAQRIEQVMINLLQNAVDALSEKEGIDALISIDMHRQGEAVIFTFTDNGPGMHPAVVEKIFEPFYTTKEVGKGTGLGLSIVFGIVKEHGGTIDCRSCQGESTSFVISFPVAENIG